MLSKPNKIVYRKQEIIRKKKITYLFNKIIIAVI